ncbi:MAG: patatin-like phospholipase family protein [Gallionella sp.]|nr:patatin-like phospholipase family protein [Gallionella sp.]
MRALIRLFILLTPLLLTACAAVQPIQYKNVIEPSATAIVPMQSQRPIVALALGSGGERGFAHVGVIKALEENGIHVDMVVGTSAGSVVGALYAGGYLGQELEHLAFQLDDDKIDDVDISKRGYIRGEALQDFINKALGNRSIEQLDKPFVAVATRLRTGDSAAFNHGNTGMAVRASSSIPGVFHPVMVAGEEYVDGDLKKPVPVSIAKEMGADIVIAVDISRHPGENPPPEGIIDILKQSIRIMRQSIMARELEMAQVVVHPAIGELPQLDLAGKQRLMKSGEEATLAQIPRILELIRQFSREKTARLPLSAVKPE